jgi:hypothetical protein
MSDDGLLELAQARCLELRRAVPDAGVGAIAVPRGRTLAQIIEQVMAYVEERYRTDREVPPMVVLLYEGMDVVVDLRGVAISEVVRQVAGAPVVTDATGWLLVAEGWAVQTSSQDDVRAAVEYYEQHGELPPERREFVLVDGGDRAGRSASIAAFLERDEDGWVRLPVEWRAGDGVSSGVTDPLRQAMAAGAALRN